MPVIIDAYNVLFAYRGMLGGDTIESTREKLIGLLTYYQKLTREKMTLIFDGSHEITSWPRKEKSGNLDIIYADPDIEADDLINDIVAESHAKRRLTVISSDRKVRNFAHKNGAVSEPAGMFIEKVLKRVEKNEARKKNSEPREKYVGLSANDVSYWKRFLGLDKEENES